MLSDFATEAGLWGLDAPKQARANPSGCHCACNILLDEVT